MIDDEILEIIRFVENSDFLLSPDKQTYVEKYRYLIDRNIVDEKSIVIIGYITNFNMNNYKKINNKILEIFSSTKRTVSHYSILQNLW